MRLPITRLSGLASPRRAASALILLLLLIPILPVATAAFAAGDEIRVLSNEREVRFPGDVVFNLGVEGEADIVEVRLYYRVTPSGIWTYTYPNLTPSRRVETSFNLNVFPPGTEMEYYYVIRDSQGNVLETRHETFVYLDNRFRWQTTDAGPLTIFWHDLSESQVQEVARQVGKSLYEISEILGVSLEKPARGIIYNSRSEAQEAFPYQSQTITQEQAFQGFAFPERGMFVGIGLQPSLIVHESAHLLLEAATTSPGVRVPAWVNEGFASYMEPGAHGSSRDFSRGTAPGLIPLRHMDTISGRPEAIRYFYRKSESVVGYLLETHGPEKFRAFLGQLDQGKNANKALIAAYGFGIDELDQRWSSSPGQGGRGDAGNNAAPFAYLDTLLIAAVALVVMGAVVSGFVVRRLRKRTEGPDEWDRLSEDEWEGRP